MTYLVQPKIRSVEVLSQIAHPGFILGVDGHLLARLILMPSFPCRLPFDEINDLACGELLVNSATFDAALEQSVHIECCTALRTMLEEFENRFDPLHERSEEAVVMQVHFVNELVQVVLVTLAEVDEHLYCLVRVGGDVLPLGRFDDADCVIHECSEVGDRAVHIGGFVDTDERFVEDGEEVAEKVESRRLIVLLVSCKDRLLKHSYFIDQAQHHDLVSLSHVQLEQLLQMRVKLRALLQLLVDLTTCVSKSHEAIMILAYLRFRQRC